MSKSIAVLGLGRFGGSLVRSLYDLGADVLAVDRDEEKVQAIAAYCTSAVCADVSEEDELLELGLGNMDVVVTAIGRDLNASIMSVAVAKEQKVPLVIAKCSSERMASLLHKVGADKTIIPEEEAGQRSARILFSDSILDYFKVGNHLSVVEIKPLKGWIGHTLGQLDLRRRIGLNILAEKEKNGDWQVVRPEHHLSADTKLLVILETEKLKSLDI